MSAVIPGGRQRASSEGDLLDEDEDEVFVNPPLAYTHRKVSQSLQLTTGNRQLRNDIAESEAETKSLAVSEAKKGKYRKPSFKSVRKFMSRVMRPAKSTAALKVENNKDTWANRNGRQPNGNSNGVRDHLVNDSHSKPGHRGTDADVPESTMRPLITNLPPDLPKWNRNPGIIGIHNHGNTCYMNAVLQCLSNTDSLTEYFVTHRYKDDLKNSKQNAKKNSKCEVTEQLAVLLKALWTNNYNVDISSTFKSVVGKSNEQYRGTLQHDSQEFLLWLLDRVHEDLNMTPKKKNKNNKLSRLHSDSDLALEAIAANNSFVYDLFQALFRSSLTCSYCGKQSNTFDPYLCISLPIPQKTMRPIYVTIVYLDANPKQVKFGLLMNILDTVKDLRQILASDTKIPVNRIVLCQIYDNGFRNTFWDRQPLSDISESETVYALEMLPPVQKVPTLNRYETQFVQIMVVHVERSSGPPKYDRFCSPQVLSIPRDVTYMELQREILIDMGSSIVSGLLKHSRLNVLFQLRVTDGPVSAKESRYLPRDVELPLFMPVIDRALLTCGEENGPPHIKLVAEWDFSTKDCVVVDDEDRVILHESVDQVRHAQQRAATATLQECFQLFTKEEKLVGEDAWLCPHCRRQQQGTIKKLSLWSLPDILVVHLKRFKQSGSRRIKLNTLIHFPVHSFNMSEVMINHGSSSSGFQNGSINLSPRQQKMKSLRRDDLDMFDLYAVCNHSGNMSGGHYTAYSKNPVDLKWYEYDDSKVTQISDYQVVTKAAYLLFYQRRPLSNLCTQELKNGTHWVYKSNPGNRDVSNGDHTIPSAPSTPRSNTKQSHNVIAPIITNQAPREAFVNPTPPTPTFTLNVEQNGYTTPHRPLERQSSAPASPTMQHQAVPPSPVLSTLPPASPGSNPGTPRQYKKSPTALMQRSPRQYRRPSRSHSQDGIKPDVIIPDTAVVKYATISHLRPTENHQRPQAGADNTDSARVHSLPSITNSLPTYNGSTPSRYNTGMPRSHSTQTNMSSNPPTPLTYRHAYRSHQYRRSHHHSASHHAHQQQRWQHEKMFSPVLKESSV